MKNVDCSEKSEHPLRARRAHQAAWRRQTAQSILRGDWPRFRKFFFALHDGKNTYSEPSKSCVSIFRDMFFYIASCFTDTVVLSRYYFCIFGHFSPVLTATRVRAAVKLCHFQPTQIHIFRQTILDAAYPKKQHVCRYVRTRRTIICRYENISCSMLICVVPRSIQIAFVTCFDYPPTLPLLALFNLPSNNVQFYKT